MKDNEILRYETRRVGKIWQVVRVWYGGWFPVNPVKGVDFKGLGWHISDAEGNA